MKPKILLIPENYPTASNPVAGIFILDQIKALKPHFDITVFNSNPWYRGVYEELADVQYFDFHLLAKKPLSPFKPLLYPVWEAQSLQLAKRIAKPDIIHLHGASLRGNWVKKLAAHWQIPYVVTEHTGPWSAIADRKMLLNRVKIVFGNAAAVWPVSHHLKAEMAESGVDMGNVEVLPNPVDTELFALRKSPLAFSKTILFLGRLDDFKGGLRSLKAFHKVEAQLPGFVLRIAGQGAEVDAISNYISTHDLADRVDFINQVLSREEMKNLFHQASLLVFPSEFESFGLVGIEAMSTGLPVVITNQTGPVDYFDETTGVAVDPTSEAEIASGMVDVASRINEFEPEDIRAHVVANFSLEAYAVKVVEKFMSIISA